jgi:hypothetical protein
MVACRRDFLGIGQANRQFGWWLAVPEMNAKKQPVRGLMYAHAGSESKLSFISRSVKCQ